MNKLICIAIISLFTLTSCAVTGPAEDQWDVEEKEDRVNLGALFGGKSKKTKKENDELRARLEKLEQQQRSGTAPAAGPAPKQPVVGSDITAPPVYGAPSSSSTAISPEWQNSASYQEWKRAKEGGSTDYQEFQEYKEWLEFQKLKQQNK